MSVFVERGDIELLDRSLERGGLVQFQVRNKASTPHVLHVQGPDVDERTDVIRHNKGALLRIRLEPGTYVLSCPLPKHTERGERAKLTVERAQ